MGGNDASQETVNAELATQAAALKKSIKDWETGTDLFKPIVKVLKVYQFRPDVWSIK